MSIELTPIDENCPQGGLEGVLDGKGMPNFFQILLNSHVFIPHGHCYLWKPGLVGLHVMADSLIALAYFSIPLSLLYFVHKRRDVPLNGLLLLFSAFIISCGITHVFEIWTLWYPTYWLSGFSKAITALVSLYTAITLVSLIPQALVLPDLAVTNQALEAEIAERRKTEAALRESEARFQAFMNNSPTASWITDELGQLVYISQTYSKVFQIPADYVPQKTDMTLYSTELRQQYLQNIQHVVRTREVLQAIEFAPIQDGMIGQFLVYKFPIETQAGQCLVGGVAIDITDRIRAEQALHQLNQELEARIEQRTTALQESKARLLAVTSLQQAILDGTDYSIISTDLNGIIQTFNAAAQKMLGYAAHEVIGQFTPVLIHDLDEIKQRTELLSAELHTPMPPGFETFVAKAKQGITSEEEWTYICKDGSRVPVLLSVTALRDTAEQVIGFLGIAKDITQQKQLEAQVRKNAAHLAAAQRIAHLGSWEFDLQTQAVIWSEEVFHLFGRDLAAGLPTWAEVQQSLHPDDRRHHDQTVQQAIVTEQSYELEFRVYHPDGTLRYLQGRGEPVFNAEGKLMRLVGTILDITDRKHSEAQLRQTNEQLAQTNMELARATRLKDEFLANMSHELRTPLNAILGLSEGLQEQVFGALNTRQIKALGTIERSGRHLLELINDILDLSKIASGKLELHLSAVSIRCLCEASLTFVKEMALKKNIQISTQIPDHLNCIQADDLRLRQVLINLLSNAVKFTPDSGSIRLEVDLEPCDSTSPLSTLSSLPTLSSPPTHYLRFAILDTGIGIAPDNIDKLFQTFVQIDSSLNRQYSGTGLGLALVRQIITLHGGTVTVSSVLGQGSCFTVRIPYHAISDVTYSEEISSVLLLSDDRSGFMTEDAIAAVDQIVYDQSDLSLKSRSSPEPPLILLVEDNQANIDTISGYLESRGYRLILATNGQQAVELAQSQQPNLILMDIQMPGMDGLAAIQQIRANGQTQLPIVALTALAMSGDREKCIGAGATDYLTKPIKLKQLTVTIQHLLLPRRRTLP